MFAMPVTHALIELLGEAALLLWGVHMVRTGVLRAFGGDLRRLLGRALRGRLTALLAGIGVTLALQSSTATALMAASFVASGMIGLSPALAVMLGANVGSALVSYALSFDITLVYPVLILAGLVIIPQQHAHPHPQPRPGSHRPRPDALGPASSGRHGRTRRPDAGSAGTRWWRSRASRFSSSL